MADREDVPDGDDRMLLHRLRHKDKKAMLDIYDRYSKHVYLLVFDRIKNATSKQVAQRDTHKILSCVFSWLFDNSDLVPGKISLKDCLAIIAIEWVEQYLEGTKRTAIK